MLVPVCVVLCVSWRCGARIALEWLHDVTCRVLWGGSRSTKPCVFPCKVAAAGDESHSSVRRLRLGSFGSFNVFCNNACSCVRSSMRFLTLWCQIALEWLHDVEHGHCAKHMWGGSRSTKPCVFPCKVASAGDESFTSSVRRLRLGSFGSFYVFCNNACSCVRSSMRFLTLWCQIALEWLHDVAWALCWGGSRSTKPCVFPCKVAAAGDESYIVCAPVAAGVVWFLLCVLQQCLFLCSVVLCVSWPLWCQIALEYAHRNKHCCMPCVEGTKRPQHATVCFSRVKWLQPAMKATSSVHTVAAGVVWFLLCVLQQCLFLCA